MKKLVIALMVLFCSLPLFAKSYAEYLAEAKKYESQKRWCYALGAYYDAMGTDELPEKKQEACEGFFKLNAAILGGKPGFGNFNDFTIHDEWKNLLIDAEKYGSSIGIYDITVGTLQKGDLDYSTRTATYSANIYYSLGDRYNHTISIIKTGYSSAYKSDWTDLPREWPLYSVSSKHNNVYNVDGALVYAKKTNSSSMRYTNAFYHGENSRLGLYDYKFNIVDEKGKELVKGKRWLLGDNNGRISFSGITSDVMDLIDNGKAFVNPVACYLEYGEYNSEDDKGGRTFIKNFPEVQLPLSRVVFIWQKNRKDKIAGNVFSTLFDSLVNTLDRDLVNIDDIQIQMLNTEVTQGLYQVVMGENPSNNKEFSCPVECVSCYDAIYFCNKLSERKGLIPVYSVDGNTNADDWNYLPHNQNSISGTVAQNEQADGFRLPTEKEWEYAARGGEPYDYAGSNKLDEVGWYSGNSGNKTHWVQGKKPNGYGLYDMSGNVKEWCINTVDSNSIVRGGCYYRDASQSRVDWRAEDSPWKRYDNVGFRIVRNLSPEQIAENHKKKLEIINNNLELMTIPDVKIQMLKTEVTQLLYKTVMGGNPSGFKGDDLPVEYVSWYDILYFCNKLSEIKGLTPVYSVNGSTNIEDWKYLPHSGKSINGTVMQNEQADGFRLPTEKEWIYAANGGEGYDYAGSSDINEVGWYKNNAGGKTHPVAQKKANGYGLYDMTGNVWEWCWDSWDSGKVMSRGSWYWDAPNCRINVRHRNGPHERYNDGGFRIVRSSLEQIAELRRKKLDIIDNNLELISIPKTQIQMLKTEVTQALYEVVMGENPSGFKGSDLPVERITWNDAIYFCNKLSEIKGFTPVYSVNGSTNVAQWNYIPHKGNAINGAVMQNENADGFRLPTENEWIYAAKGGNEYDYAGSNDINEVGWYKSNGEGKTHPVAKKKANGYGLYDMTGNVKEWCWDKWESDRIMRSGSWYHDSSNCRVNARHTRAPNVAYNDDGFRIVRSIK